MGQGNGTVPTCVCNQDRVVLHTPLPSFIPQECSKCSPRDGHTVTGRLHPKVASMESPELCFRKLGQPRGNGAAACCGVRVRPDQAACRVSTGRIPAASQGSPAADKRCMPPVSAGVAGEGAQGETAQEDEALTIPPLPAAGRVTGQGGRGTGAQSASGLHAYHHQRGCPPLCL